jgi:hypothetical protein
VAKCEGLLCFGYRANGERFAVELSDGEVEGFMPSTDWAAGGSIIEREKIALNHSAKVDVWFAENYAETKHECGKTPLIAAMRCYVASKLGDEVEIPEELK